MKKIIILVIICVFGFHYLHAQESMMDSLIQSQKKTILSSHDQLNDMLKMKCIRDRFPSDYTKIINFKRKSYDLLIKMEQTPDYSRKFELLRVSISAFNKAQYRCNRLMKKSL